MARLCWNHAVKVLCPQIRAHTLRDRGQAGVVPDGDVGATARRGGGRGQAGGEGAAASVGADVRGGTGPGLSVGRTGKVNEKRHCV